MMKEINNEMEKIYNKIKSKINDSCYFLSERDIQAYMYYKLRQKFNEKYDINLDPTITKKGYYAIKNIHWKIPAFNFPDIIISKKGNLVIEGSRPKIKDKEKCFAIEIKFIKPSIKKYSLGKEDIKKISKKWNIFPNFRIIIIDCGKENRKKTYNKIPKEKFVLITPFKIFPAGKFDDDEYSKEFEKWKEVCKMLKPTR